MAKATTKETGGVSEVAEDSKPSTARRSDDPLPFPAEPTAQQVRDQEAAQQKKDDARRERFAHDEREALLARDRRNEDVAEAVEKDRVVLETEAQPKDHPDTRPAGE